MSTRIPQDFSQVSFQQARRLVQSNQPDEFDTNEKFFDGDHWQDGEGWPQEIDATADGAEYLRKLIQELFESKNIIKEVTERFMDGVLEVKPDAGFAPAEEDEDDAPDEVIGRAEELTQETHRWMERRKFGEEVEEALKYALLGGRGYLRPFVPPTRRDETGGLSGTWDEVLGNVFVHAIRPTAAVVFTHPDTERKLSIYHWVPGDALDVTDPGRHDDREMVELSWVDPESGETVMRILKEGEVPADAPDEEQDEDDAIDVFGDEEKQNRELRLDLDGHLFLQEIEVEQLITEQVRSSQKSFNLTKTMQTHNEVSSGFSERVFFNAQPPGSFEEKEDGSREFVPNKLRRGPFRTHFVRGLTTEDEFGNDQLEQPSMEIDDADDPEVYLKGKSSKRKDILDEVNQTYVLMNERAELSGKSRLIARHEFAKTLTKAVEPISELYRGTIMTATVIATEFGSDAPSIEDLRVPVEVFTDTGPLTPEEMNALSTMTETGLMSMQTALSRAGINDIEAEMQRIEEEEDTRLQRLQERAKLVKELVAAGASLPGAAQVAGWDEEEAQKLQMGLDGSLAEAVQASSNGQNPR